MPQPPNAPSPSPPLAVSSQAELAASRAASQPPSASGRFFGKYRGVVADNQDTQALGRIRATLPSFQGLLTNWALPCTPYAGTSVGFFTLPPIGASVWIEFEGGNPSYPVWSGCFWEVGDLPSDILSLNSDPSQMKFWKTASTTLILNDSSSSSGGDSGGGGSSGGGVSLTIVSPAVQTPITVTMNSQGVTVTCGVSQALLDPQNGITLTVDSNKTQIVLSPQAVTGSSTAITCTAEQGLTLKGGTVDVESDGTATFAANGGEVKVSGSTAATFKGGTSAELSANGAITISGGEVGEVSVNGSAVSIKPMGEVTIDTPGAVNITAGLEAGMTAGLDLSLKAGAAAELNAGADVNIGALAAIEIEAALDISYTGLSHMMTGMVEVNGVLTEDGMPVLVAPF